MADGWSENTTDQWMGTVCVDVAISHAVALASRLRSFLVL